ncbi:hypothetical protein ACFL54_07760 [Planctomycetota bacterium]
MSKQKNNIEDLLGKYELPKLTTGAESRIVRGAVKRFRSSNASLQENTPGYSQTSSKAIFVYITLAACALIALALLMYHSRSGSRQQPRQRPAVANSARNAQEKALQPVLRHLYTQLNTFGNIAVVEEGKTTNLFLVSESDKLAVWIVRKLTDRGMEIEHSGTGEVKTIPLTPLADGIAGYSEEVPAIYAQWKANGLQAANWENLAELASHGDGVKFHDRRLRRPGNRHKSQNHPAWQ